MVHVSYILQIGINKQKGFLEIRGQRKDIYYQTLVKCRSLKSHYHRLLLYRAFHYHCKIILHSCKALQCFADVIPLLKRIVNFYQPPCGLNSQH